MTEKLPRDMTENELRYHCAALGDEIERLTAENERLKRTIDLCSGSCSYQQQITLSEPTPEQEAYLRKIEESQR